MGDTMQHIPNSFQVPNHAIDVVMSKVSPAAFKCYLCVMRKTTGWQKASDKISLSQLESIIGLSGRQIQRAMKELQDLRLIERIKTKNGWSEYSLVTHMSPPSDTDVVSPSDIYGALQNPTITKPTKQNASLSIFEFWKKAMQKSANTKFTAGRKRAVEARLKSKYTAEEILRAIDNCSKSPFHMGKNDNGSLYNDLTLICRSDEKLEFFRDMTAAKTLQQPQNNHQTRNFTL